MDNQVIATAAVADHVINRFQESAPEARPETDPRFEGMTDIERARFVAGLTNALGAARLSFLRTRPLQIVPEQPQRQRRPSLLRGFRES